MAAAKRKTSRKSKTAPKKSPAKAQTNLMYHPLVRLCFLICFAALSIASIFKMGVIGRFFYQLAVWLCGYLVIPFYILCTILCGYKLFSRNKKIPLKIIAGVIFLWAGLELILAGMQYSAIPAASVLSGFFSRSLAILQGQMDNSGLLGALLYSVFGLMFDAVGAYLFAVIFILIGILFCGYDWYTKEKRSLPAVKMPQLPKFKNPFNKEEDSYDALDYEEDLFFESTPPSLAKKEEFTPAKESSFKIIDADRVMEVGAKSEKTITKTKKAQKPFGIIADGKDEQARFDFEQDDLNNIIEETSKALKSRTSNAVSAKKEEPAKNEEAVSIRLPDPSYENYKLPKLNILNEPPKKGRGSTNFNAAKSQGQKLIDILHQFNVNARLDEVHIGPSVTKFEIKLEPGVRVNKITSLQGDIKMALAAKDIRIEAPIPGKSAVGIEIPNLEKTTVYMKEVLRQVPDVLSNDKTLVALGKDLMGECVFGRLDKMPHLLIAGATGSGKSVCVNSIICSLLLRSRPDEVKLILIDPKKVEFTPYNDVPHLLAPVITDGELANKGLQVVVRIMDERYDLFEACGVKNIESYNRYLKAHPEESLKTLPRIVVIIDELADLMLVAAKEVEQSVQRITQLARAAGIHLIVATQRPSVDIITGVIKANIPSRIAFAVSQAVDSRTILDQTGAEKLLGYGDMLYLPNGETVAKRVQGVFIQDEEVNRITQAVKEQGKPSYDDAFIQLKDLQNQGKQVAPEKTDPLYTDVKNFVISTKRASTSLIQRKFSIGYGRAARLIDVLEANGIVGPANGSKPRKILVQTTFEPDEDNL